MLRAEESCQRRYRRRKDRAEDTPDQAEPEGEDVARDSSSQTAVSSLRS